VRGATTAADNTAAEILDATRELLEALCTANGMHPDAVASAVFTVTPDLSSAFPARAARDMGWGHVPLLDAVEIDVPGAMPRCIRVLLHWNTDLPANAVRHVYLRGAAALRPDLCDGPGGTNMEEAVPAAPATPTEPGPVSAPAGDTRAPQPLKVTVAYQGEPGAYSQEAIFQHFGTATGTQACESFEEIFAAVEDSRVDFGLLPIENSRTGSIHQSYDLLLEHDLHVVGEVKYRVRHCLLAPPGLELSEIRKVRSHPQALAQIERFLKRRGWQAVPAYDTAGAARELAADPQPGTAAVASALAGQTYGLKVLETGIEDAPDNTTRFFVLSRDTGVAGGPATGPYKTSLVFATTHTPGALHRALGEFAERGLNLTKIESRPRRNRPWHYVFYLDFDGHWQDPPVAQALVALLAHSAFLKLLGSYSAAE
jgi:prephenate dehydratase